MDVEDIVFRGGDGRECEGFIRAVRKAAFSAGKIRDDGWMADFASTCFEGKALRFFESLPPNVQSDWRQLRQALLQQYPIGEEEVSSMFSSSMTLSSMVPAAAPAVPMGASMSLQAKHVGRIKIIGTDGTNYGYIKDCKPSWKGCLNGGASLSESLKVAFIPSDRPHDLEVMGVTLRSEVIGVKWKKSDPSIQRGSPDYGSVTGFNGPSRSPINDWEGPSRTMLWKIGFDGTVSCLWESRPGGEALSIGFVLSNDADKSLEVTADTPVFLDGPYGGTLWKGVRLIFEKAS